MQSKWLSLAVVVVLLCGCWSKHESPAVSLPRGTPAGLTDSFGLPLVIVIDAPEVPEAIRGPSPPMKTEQKAAPKTPNALKPWH